MSQPFTYRCVSGTLIPKQRWAFDRAFVEGHDYTLIEHEERSSSSHAHFFATVNEAWKTLPESQSKRWSDATHMRKWFLIKTGWSIERIIVAETDHVAKEIAALAGQLDHSAVITIQGSVVTVSVARSQKSGKNGMNKEDFQRSKSDVLGELAILLGVDVATLSAQVSNSSAPTLAGDRTDTPAAEPGPHPGAAGVPHLEVSLLSPDWRDVYLRTMTNPTTRAWSIQTRDTTALQMMGGVPNATEWEWMRQVATLTNRRDKGKLKVGQFEAELEKLKSTSEAKAAV